VARGFLFFASTIAAAAAGLFPALTAHFSKDIIFDIVATF